MSDLSDREELAIVFAREQGMVPPQPPRLWTPDDFYNEDPSHRMLNALEGLRYILQRLTSGTLEEHKQFEAELREARGERRPWAGMSSSAPNIQATWTRHLVREATPFLERSREQSR